MSYRLEPHEIGERTKLIMRRMRAREIFYDPELIEDAKRVLEVETVAKSSKPDVQAWVALWKGLLYGPREHLAQLLHSRKPEDMQTFYDGPFVSLKLAKVFANEDWRRRAWRKSRQGIISLQASLASKGDPLANHQFMWSEHNRRLEGSKENTPLLPKR